jgi:Domain of Unknown Function (DUF1206)
MDDTLHRLAHLKWIAQLGYATRGMVYVLLGIVVLVTGRGHSTVQVVESVRLLPLGTLLLLVIAIGLFGYGLFRLYEAVLDLERRGDGWGGRAARIGRSLGGLGYWLLAFVAVRTAFAGPIEAVGEAATREAGRDLGAAPGGGLVLFLIGAGVLGIAVGQAVRSWRCDFMMFVDPQAPRVVRHLGRAGFAARAVMIALVGWFVIRAGMAGEPLRGMGGALDALHRQTLLFTLVGIGLSLFGVFSLALARYRHVRDDDLIEHAKALGDDVAAAVGR